MAGELFKVMAGVNMVHVPYRGNAPAVTDLIAGQMQLMFADAPSSIEHIKAGKLRALAVTTAVRSEILPEVPTVNEFVPGYEASFWSGIGAPKNTPAEIIDRLNKVERILAPGIRVGISPYPRAIEFWKARGRPASRCTSSTVDVLALRHPSNGTVATV
jgi:hypothetical protein